jgi:hypothetical protein
MTMWFSVTEVAARSASNQETDDLRRSAGRLQQAPATSTAGRAGLQRRHRRARLRQALTVSRRGLDVTVSAVPIRATRRPSPGGCVTSTQVGHMWIGEARFVVGRGVCGGLGVSRASARGLGRPGAYRAWAVSRDGRDVGASPRTCNRLYPAGDGATLCPPLRPNPPGHLRIRPRASLRVKVRGATRVRCALTRPHKHQPTSARAIARLAVHRVPGSQTVYRAVLPRPIPAHTRGLACTADFRHRRFADYDLGVHVSR